MVIFLPISLQWLPLILLILPLVILLIRPVVILLVFPLVILLIRPLVVFLGFSREVGSTDKDFDKFCFSIDYCKDLKIVEDLEAYLVLKPMVDVEK